ncbi:hypothetical protein AYO38_01385 [bacterium SCGC AG-212-C10]|nr:hypothetical protein AYO38_01385 [bacterium SCGC AG-212-C10]
MQRSDNYWLRRKVSRRGFVAGSGAAVAGAAAFAAVGCGDDDDGESATATTGSSAPTTAGGATAAATSAASRPAPNGTLKVAVASLMDQSADPFFQTGGLAQAINTHAFESFFRVNDDGQREAGLAESYEVAPDRMSMTFKMRKGVKFWDGTEMTAKDAAFSYDAYINRTPPNPSAAVLKGIVESATATDDTTLVVKFKVPTAFEGREITWFNITSQAYYEKVGAEAFKTMGMGSGPFKITKNEKGQYMEFEAHEQHWRKDRVPMVKTMRMSIVPELQTRIAQLKTGEADITEGVTGATALSLQNEKGIKIVTSGQTAWLKVNFFEPQTGASPWTDKRLREALIISINQEGIASGLLKQGKPSPNVQMWPKTLGYSEADFPVRKFDAARAKALVKEAGVEGLSFDLHSYSSSSYPLIPETTAAIAGFYTDIGLKPKIVQNEGGGYFTSFTNRKLTGVGSQGWPFMADARLIVYQYYKSGSPYGNTDNQPEIEEGVKQMIAATKQEEQLEIAKKVHKYVYDNMFFAAAPWSDSQWATSDKVQKWIRPAGDPYMTRLESVELKA